MRILISLFVVIIGHTSCIDEITVRSPDTGSITGRVLLVHFGGFRGFHERSRTVHTFEVDDPENRNVWVVDDLRPFEASIMLIESREPTPKNPWKHVWTNQTGTFTMKDVPIGSQSLQVGDYPSNIDIRFETSATYKGSSSYRHVYSWRDTVLSVVTADRLTNLGDILLLPDARGAGWKLKVEGNHVVADPVDL